MMSPVAGLVPRALLASLVLAGGACWDSSRPERDPLPPIGPVPAEIDVGRPLQAIDGFGASSAWTANNISDALADQLFSVETGIGLSLLRVQIKPTGVTNELATAQKAAARGAKVWAAPWSPPAEWKSNGNVRNGGSLLPQHRQDWADRLATFAKSMADVGVPLVALSAQNEPDFDTPDWETCLYTPAELTAFVRDFLGPALAAQGVNTPVMAPETANWTSFPEFAASFASDAAAMTFLGPFATHAYGGGEPHAVPMVEQSGKHVWQTEVSVEPATPFDPGIDSALVAAQMIHDNLVHGGVSAWHYWWINPSSMANPRNDGLTGMGQLTRRAWVMGNWSRFVRPGYVRVAAEPPMPQAQVFVTAFADVGTGKVVIVAINRVEKPREQVFSIAGAAVTQVTPWVTSADLMLVQGAPLPVIDGGFTATLAARSVTTFVSP
jgi:glucuronoarabinoxylan endo-1,4-beta-xylanase